MILNESLSTRLFSFYCNVFFVPMMTNLEVLCFQIFSSLHGSLVTLWGPSSMSRHLGHPHTRDSSESNFVFASDSGSPRSSR